MTSFRGELRTRTMLSNAASCAWLFGCLGGAILSASASAVAQDQVNDPDDAEKKAADVIVVEGYREVIRNSLAAKKSSEMVSDGISSADIGNLPSTSLGESLATIPGASVTRLKGGVSEVAIRGLGPFLTASRFNGRPASNGSGDRSVNYGIFPSEMANKVTIYKSQQADLVEGGVAGVIDVGTVLPLDYGKRRILLDAKAVYSDQAADADGYDGWGHRATLSYLDQFDLEDGGEFGLSVGIQSNLIDSPLDRHYGSGTWNACDATVVRAPDANGRYDACTSTVIDLDGANRDNPFYLAQNSFGIRHDIEEDERNSAFAAFQWRPSESLEFVLDGQYANRVQDVDIHDLIFGDGRRVGNPEYDSDGVLLAFDGSSLISADNRLFERDEKYQAIAFNTTWEASDRLTLELDLSYSDTVRDELTRRARVRSDGLDIYGNEVALRDEFPGFSGYVPIRYELTSRKDAPTITVDPRFDVTDHSLFSDDLAIIRDYRQRAHNIKGVQLDGTYAVDGDFIKNLKVGVRVAEETYDEVFLRNNFSQSDRDVDRMVNEACRIDFPADNFLSGSDTAGIRTYAAFDTACQYRMYTGSEDIGLPDERRSIANKDVSEKTYAAYVMAEYESVLGDMPLSGNFGVRVVQTDITSVGLRSGLTVEDAGAGNLSLVSNGDFDSVKFENDTFDVLPSFNGTLGLSPNVLLRGAVYRALARPENSTLGAGRTFSLNSDDDGFPTLEEAISSVSANGSPGLEPLRAWNADLSLEWYPNDETLLAAAVYHKRFEGGQIPVIEDETFNIDGTSVTVPVTQNQTTDEESSLTGIELQAVHTFSYLPAPFDGFGVKLGYNYADSDYEEHDIRLGDSIDAETGEFTPGIIPPADISGYSKHVAAAQIFYEIGNLDLQTVYRHRSDYQIGFLGGGQQLRYIRGSDVWDARASYKLNSNVSLTLQAVNLMDEPRVESMPVVNSPRDFQYYGTTYFFGVKIRH